MWRRPTVAVAVWTATGIACVGDAGSPPNPSGIFLSDVTARATGSMLPAGAREGIGHTIVGSGGAIGDLDGDGDLDVVLARAGSSGEPSMVLRNETTPGGAISLVRSEAFPGDAYGVALGDFDNDGDLDLFFACQGPNQLYRNDGGVFTDVTGGAGVMGGDVTSSGAIWADLNNDGLLDLYVANYAPSARERANNRVYLNLGDGTFADVSERSEAGSAGDTITMAAADLDGDGVVDLYVANDNGSVEGISTVDDPMDALYIRRSVDDQGVPIFRDTAAERGVRAHRSSMGIALADFDADGDLDAYVTDWGANELYLWDGSSGSYANQAREYNTAVRAHPDGDEILLIGWGALPLDLDRDGALELFVVNGALPVRFVPFESYPDHQLSAYLRQASPGSRFDSITESVGLPTDSDPHDAARPIGGRGAFTGDLDADGDDDLLTGAHADSFRIYENSTREHGNYVRLRLRGTVSAPDPVGAVVSITKTDGVTVSRQRTVGGEPYGQSDAVVEVGLGDELPEHVEIRWPSGLVQRVKVAVNDETEVVEPRWLSLSSRSASRSESPPVLTYHGTPGGSVVFRRSDGVQAVAIDNGDGSYSAELTHPGVTRRTTVSILIDGTPRPIKPMVTYR